MKPTTQAKTARQLCNQIEAMEEILKSVLAGAKELGMMNCKANYPSALALGEALEEVRLALHYSYDSAFSRAGAEGKAKEKERNRKYKYLRQEYYARNSDCPYLKERAMSSAAAGRNALREHNELLERNKAQHLKDKLDTERQKAELKLHQQLREDNLEQARIAREMAARREAERLAPKVDYVPNASEPDEVPY
jgi:hypothetical protein